MDVPNRALPFTSTRRGEPPILALALQPVAVGTMLTDPDRRLTVTYVNQCLCGLVDRSTEDVLGRSLQTS